MEMYGYSITPTSTKNNTNIGDFCIHRPVGPLIWTIVCVPSACVGVPASGWLLWLLVQMQLSGSSNNLYMLNLTIMDLLFNLSIIPNVINFYVWHETTLEMIFTILLHSIICGRPLFMSCICVDCYVAVVYPVSYMTIKNKRYRVVFSALVWILILCLNIMTLIYENFFYQSLPLLLSLSALIITFYNISTFCALRKPDPSGRAEVHPQKRRAKQSIINSLVMAIVSYPPLVIVCTFYLLNNMSEREFDCEVLIPCLTIATTGSSIMPLLYLGNLGKLKRIKLIAYKWLAWE